MFRGTGRARGGNNMDSYMSEFVTGMAQGFGMSFVSALSGFLVAYLLKFIWNIIH